MPRRHRSGDTEIRPDRTASNRARSEAEERRRAQRDRAESRNEAWAADRPAQVSNTEGLLVEMRRLSVTEPGFLEKPYYFQCPPLETFSIQGAYNHAEYETIRSGQFSRAQGRQLRVVSFNTLFIDFDPIWAVTHADGEDATMADPLDMTQELFAIMDSGSPFMLYVGQTEYWGPDRFDVAMPATLRSLAVEERAGEIDTRYADVSFSEWRSASVLRRGVGRGGGRGGGRALPTIHTIRRGDTLHKIARTYYAAYGSPSSFIPSISYANYPYLTDVSHHRDLNDVRGLFLGRRRGLTGKLRIPNLPGVTDNGTRTNTVEGTPADPL